MAIDIEKIILNFRERFESGKLKKDDLENSFPKFEGEIENADNEAFNRFANTVLYKRILGL